MVSMLSNHKVLIPVWIAAVLGVFTLVEAPLTFASGSLLAFMAVAPLTILSILSKAPTLTLSEAIAEELRPVDRSRTAE